jgi:UDP-N-acetylglucosamine acyltransferase
LAGTPPSTSSSASARSAFIAANAMVSQDVPPGCLAAGDRARLYGLNVTGLRRAGVPAGPPRLALGLSLALRVAALRRDPATRHRPRGPLRLHPQISDFIDFVRASARGIWRAAGRPADDRADGRSTPTGPG